MIIVSLLAAQLTAAAPIDSNYSSRALRDFVAAAAEENRRVPEVLSGYRAHVESDVSLLAQDSAQREATWRIEQYAASVAWTRRSGYSVHVIGYRSPHHVVPLSWLPRSPGWTAPNLYGERLPFAYVERRSGRGEATLDTVVPIHPFAADRESRYSYSGGDTVATLHVRGRSIPIVHIRVVPRIARTEDGAAYDGDLYVDANRHQIVRLRGRFVRFHRPESGLGRFEVVTATEVTAYVDITNEEVDGQFWLPSRQRIEMHLGSGLFGSTRLIARMMANFSQYSLDTAGIAQQGSIDDGLPQKEITFATDDSLRSYGGWFTAPGESARQVRSTDFADLAPAVWRADGPPQLILQPSRFSRLVHFDRIEGYFTGGELAIHFRDAFPQLSVRAFGGWAWAEQTARGGMSLRLQRDGWTTNGYVERALETTNEFVVEAPFASNAFGSVMGNADDHDYVDRWKAVLSESKALSHDSDRILTIQVGMGRDRAAYLHADRGLLSSPVHFRPNRFVAEGSYARASVSFEFHPEISSASLESGFGGRIHYEAAVGELAWQRALISLRFRHTSGPFTVSQRVDAGAVGGRELPPQQLLQFGGAARLLGYEYKQFAGDRAAIVRTLANYQLPLGKRPRRLFGWINAPAPSPGIGATLEGGWSELSSNAARMAATAIGNVSTGIAVPEPTRTLRGSVGVGITMFSGILHAGVARPLDPHGQWHRTIGVGSVF